MPQGIGYSPQIMQLLQSMRSSQAQRYGGGGGPPGGQMPQMLGGTPIYPGAKGRVAQPGQPGGTGQPGNMMGQMSPQIMQALQQRMAMMQGGMGGQQQGQMPQGGMGGLPPQLMQALQQRMAQNYGGQSQAPQMLGGVPIFPGAKGQVVPPGQPGGFGQPGGMQGGLQSMMGRISPQIMQAILAGRGGGRF